MDSAVARVESVNVAAYCDRDARWAGFRPVNCSRPAMLPVLEVREI